MVNCSHCGKELKRNVFCSASCKTMFHRKGKRGFEKLHYKGKEVKEPRSFSKIVSPTTQKVIDEKIQKDLDKAREEAF